MVAEQTAGRRETALDGYKAILASSDCPKSIYVQEFIHDQIVLCLLFSYRFHDLYDILIKEESRETPRRTIPILNINSSQVRAMIKYDEDPADRSISDLSNWESLDEVKDCVSDFSYYTTLCLAESAIFKACFPGFLFTNELANNCFEIIHNSLHECLRTKSREHLEYLTFLNHVCHKLTKFSQDRGTVDLQSLCINKSFGSIPLVRLLEWIELFEGINSVGSDFSIKMRLDLASRQRKEGNLQFCKTELSKFFKKCDYAKNDNLLDKFDVDMVQEMFTKSEIVANTNIWDANMSRGVYETCKLMYCSPKQKNRAIQLASSTTLGICNRLNAGEKESELKERAARILLTISEWLLLENDTIITSDQNSSLVHLLTTLPDIRPHPDEATPAAIPIIDASVGKLIQHSLKQCPELAKAWYALGNW